MSSLARNTNDTVGITETTSKAISNYGVASGSAYLQDYNKRINVLLKDSIKSKWDTYVTDPNTSKILFLNTWFTGAKDYEIIFRQGFEERPALRGARTTDLRYQKTISTVDIHVGVRSKGGDVEPPVLHTLINALEKIVSLNNTTLIDNAVCEIVSNQMGPTEKPDDRQTWWHVLVKVRVWFWKVKTV